MNFTKKTIKSNYLNEEFEASCWEMSQGGRTITIVEHAAFEDIVFNRLAKLDGFKHSIEPIVGFSHPVVKCIMRDNTGREITAIGEAHPDTLVNSISKQNPVIMAGNRAFDRAAIRFLNLDGKVYSSEEIPDSDNSNESSSMSSKSETTTDDDITIIEEIEAPDDANNANPNTKAETDDYDSGATVINFGKYRGKNKTVAEIWSSDPSWADYSTKMNLDSCGETTKKQIRALKDYKLKKDAEEKE